MQAAVSAKDALSRSVNDAVAARGTVAVFVVLTLLVIVVIITYLVWRMNRSKLSAVKVLSDPTKLNGNTITPFPAANLPVLKTGQPFSVSFWIYLTDFQPTANGKLIMWRTSDVNQGSGPVQMFNANPLVFLDPSVNSMYVSIKTTRPIPDAAKPNIKDLSALITKGSDAASGNKWTYLTGKVDYVPLQRWVNYTFTVQNNLLSVYQDGSLYTVSDLFDMIDMQCTPGTSNCAARPLFAGVTGAMTIGNPSTCSSTESSVPGNVCISDVNGFISRVQFFNYALTSKQAKEVYYAGPGSGGMLRILGLPEYGVRSPIYRTDTDGNNDD